MVVLFGQPHLEEIVLVLDLREPDGCQPGEDQWQEYENDVMAVEMSIEIKVHYRVTHQVLIR